MHIEVALLREFQMKVSVRETDKMDTDRRDRNMNVLVPAQVLKIDEK